MTCHQLASLPANARDGLKSQISNGRYDTYLPRFIVSVPCEKDRYVYTSCILSLGGGRSFDDSFFFGQFGSMAT
jgi:hypothetical protein